MELRVAFAEWLKSNWQLALAADAMLKTYVFVTNVTEVFAIAS
jgi:hypothetical protein